jgi:transposase
MRKLPAAAQEERRRQVVGLRRRGLTYRATAEQVGLSRTGVINICQRFARGRGREGPGEQAARAQAG